MTAVATNFEAPTKPKAKSNGRSFDASVSGDEVQFIALALAVLGAWVGAVLAFGFAGLIVGALSLVAVMFVALILISRG